MVTEETRAGTRRKISRGHTALKWLGGCRKRRKDISVYIYIFVSWILCAPFSATVQKWWRGAPLFCKRERGNNIE